MNDKKRFSMLSNERYPANSESGICRVSFLLKDYQNNPILTRMHVSIILFYKIIDEYLGKEVVIVTK
jgi:hypothetical protein